MKRQRHFALCTKLRTSERTGEQKRGFCIFWSDSAQNPCACARCSL